MKKLNSKELAALQKFYDRMGRDPKFFAKVLMRDLRWAFKKEYSKKRRGGG